MRKIYPDYFSNNREIKSIIAQPMRMLVIILTDNAFALPSPLDSIMGFHPGKDYSLQPLAPNWFLI
jgi:hypothetical protein